MSLSFDHQLGFGSLFLVILGIFVAVVFFYQRVFESHRDRRLWILVALRVAALTLVVLLLYRPVASVEQTEKNPGQLAVVVDTSGSMSVQDDSQGRTRLQQAQQVLLEHERQLTDVFDVRAFQFDTSATQLKQLSAVGRLTPTTGETNLAGALQTAVRSGSKGRTVAVVVLSDGIDNSGQDVVAVAKDLGVPVYTVATGYNLAGTDSGHDVVVSGVECAERLPLKTQAKIVALIDGRGVKGRVAQVELVEKEKVIASGTTTLDDLRGVQRVELFFTPETKGRHEYTIRVPQLSDELIAQNNEHSVSTVVVDARLRVLYVEGSIRAEYGTLVGRYLAHDPTIEYLAMVQTRPGLFIQRTNIEDWKSQGIPSTPEDLKTFDVFIIGNLDSKFLGAARMSEIEKLVRDGKGLIMLGGSHSFGAGGYGDTPLANVLPVDVSEKAAKQVTEPFQMKLTAAGRAHPVFSGIAEFFGTTSANDAVPALPTLLGCTLLDRPKPSAEVLAIHPERGNENGPLTVLAVHPYGKGRAAAFAGDTTYRWYQVMRGLEEASPYIRFWGQLIRWLAGKDETESLQPGLTVNTDKGFYKPGESIRLEAQLIGDDGRGVDDAMIEAVFQSDHAGDASAHVLFEHQPDRAGSYVAEYTAPHPALYSVKVQATGLLGAKANTADYTKELQVQVGHPSAEYDRLDMDETTLQAIAEATGGRYIHVARAGRLFENLVNQQRQKRVLLEQRLYYPPLFWVLCIGLITTEWLLRRKYRLR